MKKLVSLARFIHLRFSLIPFSGRVGFLISLIYVFLLPAYHFTHHLRDNTHAESVIQSDMIYPLIAVYLLLVIASLLRPIRGSAFATCFIGVQGIFGSIHPFDAASVILIIIWLVFPILAVHGVIEWYDDRHTRLTLQQAARRSLEHDDLG